ncbi:hypothetical protein HZH66_013098 [Vespula vulgaris]|uniref:Wolframin n=1 Tax=Vespula vulgaris TaxID=7454 RepID=A0A834JBV5_VESVU|nr:hypothetical protein HZH66_013098 [Vespula vulgaris]
MAGIMPLSGRPGRKQWTLHGDGTRGSLRRLRSQMAEDGCPESQVVLAKQLLEERCDLEVDKEENAKLGVYWLTKASEQGNLEATEILKQCLATGRGITEHNYYDVKNCLDMTQDEKLAKKAAREMFTSLSNGEDFITTEQLQRCMRDVTSPSSSRFVNCQSPKSSSSASDEKLNDVLSNKFSRNGLPEDNTSIKEESKIHNVTYDWMGHQSEKITEAALVSAATSYAHGMLPMVSRTLCMVDSPEMELATIPLLQRPFIHPCYTESPYGHFFLALLLNLMIYPVIAHQWTPQSEFTIISVTLTLVTLLNFMWNNSSNFPDLLALFSFGVHVLAKYPYETDIVVAQGWRFLDIRVPTFASYVVGNGIEFCLNFRVVFYLLIPAVFCKMAARENWRGTYKTLIPHCVTLSWWQIAIFSSQSATWYGLIRGALALVGMVLFLPIAGLASIILPIIAAAKYLSESDLAMRIIVTAILGGLPFVASWYMRRLRTPRFNWIITVVQLVLGTSAAIFLSWQVITEYKEDSDNNSYEIAATLSWEQYQNHCHQPAWEDISSKAQVQIECAHLEGIPISWEGYVTNVRLKSIRNNIGTILRMLPDSIRTTFSCTYGEPYKENCDTYDEIRRKNCEHFVNIQKKRHKCHFPAWDQYEFEIFVKMKSGIWRSNAEIVLIADHSFTNFSLSIYPRDKIWFSGTLSNTGLEKESLLGGGEPHIELDEISCLACHSADLKSFKRHKYHITLTSIVNNFWLGIKTVLNFLLNPIVLFK